MIVSGCSTPRSWSSRPKKLELVRNDLAPRQPVGEATHIERLLSQSALSVLELTSHVAFNATVWFRGLDEFAIESCGRGVFDQLVSPEAHPSAQVVTFANGAEVCGRPNEQLSKFSSGSIM